jgi:xanthine dehydrogenase accessory factor
MTQALELVGAVSGGCLEGYIGRVARRLLAGRDSVLLSFDTAEESPSRPTLGCGGRLEVLVEMAGPEHLDYLDAVAHAMRTSDRAAVLIRFDSSGSVHDPRCCRAVFAGGQFIFGSPSGLTEGTFDLVDNVIDLRETLTWRTGEHCCTSAYLWPQPRVVIFGARDDAQPLVQIAKAASWHVTVADRRDRLADRARFPEADAVVAAPWDDAIAAIGWTRWTSAILMTHSIEDDLRLLPLLEQVDLDYLGVLGPSARTQRLWEGITPAQRQRIHSPVGLPLGEKSPAAVAIAIMAELIAHRRGRAVSGRRAAGKAAR